MWQDSHFRSSAETPTLKKRRMFWGILCLSVIVLAWTGLIILAYQPMKWAITLVHELFGWTVLATYFAVWAAIILGARKRKRSIFCGIMFTFTLVAVLGVFEAAAAMKLIHWKLIIERISGDGTNYMWSYKLDPELGFRRQPNDHWAGRPPSDIEASSLMPATLREPISFTYDHWGYRNSPELDKADIALIGDSYVEGWYVSDNQTASSRLQIYLGRPVANLGVAGYGTLQEFIVLKKDVPKFDPKVVVWFFFEGNDFYNDQRFENSLLSMPTDENENQAQPEGLRVDDGWKQRSFVRNFLVRLRRWLYPILPALPVATGHLTMAGNQGRVVYFADYAAVPWSDWLEGRWEKAQKTFKKGAEFAHRNGIRLLIVFVPIKFRVYHHFVEFAADGPENSWTTWPIDEQFTVFCRAVGIPCIDLTQFFEEALVEGGMPYAAVDTHWSPEGHDLVAQILKAELERRGWLNAK